MARHVKSGNETDVSAAVDRLMKQDLAPVLRNSSMLNDNNDFRKRNCYTEAVDTVLRSLGMLAEVLLCLLPRSSFLTTGKSNPSEIGGRANLRGRRLLIFGSPPKKDA